MEAVLEEETQGDQPLREKKKKSLRYQQHPYRIFTGLGLLICALFFRSNLPLSETTIGPLWGGV